MKSGEKLNVHSQKVYDILKKDFSKILKYASKSPSDEGDFFLKIEFESPNVNEEFGIYFDTEDNMLTVGFSCYHYHTYFFAETVYEEEVLSATGVIQSIMDNELFAAKIYKKGRYTSSILLEKEVLTNNELKNHRWLKQDCDKVEIISWNGDFDQEIVLTGGGLKDNLMKIIETWFGRN